MERLKAIKNFICYIILAGIIFSCLPTEWDYEISGMELKTNEILAKEQVKVIYQPDGGIVNDNPGYKPVYFISAKKQFPLRAISISILFGSLLCILDPLKKTKWF